MHIAFVQMKGLGLSPEARALFASYLRVYAGRPIGRTEVQALSVGLRQSTPVSNRALDELQSRDFIRMARVAEGKGRPRDSLECTERLLERLAAEEGGAEQCPLSHLVDQVLHPENQIQGLTSIATTSQAALVDSPAHRKVTARKRLKGKASATNRLLLAVLLCYADRFGVVRSTGFAALSDLTGLGRESLKAHLHKLNELGLISHKIVGFSGSRLLGSWDTVYFLNLHHPSLVAMQPQLVTLVLQADKASYGGQSTEAGKIISLADLSRGARFDWSKHDLEFLGLTRDFDHLAAFFVPQRNLPGGVDAVASALQFLLDGYASRLLSTRWSQLSKDTFFVDEALMACAKADFKPRSRSLMLYDGVTEQCGGQFLYEVSFALACRLKQLLLPLEELAFDEMQFQVLPPTNPVAYQGVRALLALPKEQEFSGACFVVQALRGEATCERLEAILAIDLDQRASYGLHTKFRALKRYGSSVS
ncbi:hypothetical protein [Pseudomonas sp. BN411]|uniref:hypothetical protein n=1 Tax=Pseudomonas sp. BN411 TaxID=2567887 RepID=UPI002453C30B|nr:hypothetical protein [Pseudomonas sp. BN411]MDH4562327.1 hypothetical protein [Pseudomonas sp. BN411]